MNNLNLVILAAGISSRMKKSITGSATLQSSVLQDGVNKPKSMMRVGKDERPFMDYLLYNALKAGYRDIVIVIGDNDNSVRQCYGAAERNNHFHGLTISYAVQRVPSGRTKPLGTADALNQALLSKPEWKGDTFVVCNSDNLYSVNALNKLLVHPSPNAMIDYDRETLGFEQARIEQFAVIQKDEDGFLTAIIEKPSAKELNDAKDSRDSVGVSMNIFKFEYNTMLPILEQVPLHPTRHEKELPRAVSMLIQKAPRSMTTIPLSEIVIDLTSKDDIEGVREFLSRNYADFLWEP